jgi:hypothetical protein
MKKFVIIIYSVEGSDQSIKDNIKLLGDWFNYFQGSWLVLTRLSVQDIYNRIGTNKSDDRFLVMEIDLKTYWGILPTEAWDWLKSKKNEQGQW